MKKAKEFFNLQNSLTLAGIVFGLLAIILFAASAGYIIIDSGTNAILPSAYTFIFGGVGQITYGQVSYELVINSKYMLGLISWVILLLGLVTLGIYFAAVLLKKNKLQYIGIASGILLIVGGGMLLSSDAGLISTLKQCKLPFDADYLDENCKIGLGFLLPGIFGCISGLLIVMYPLTKIIKDKNRNKNKDKENKVNKQ